MTGPARSGDARRSCSPISIAEANDGSREAPQPPEASRGGVGRRTSAGGGDSHSRPPGLAQEGGEEGRTDWWREVTNRKGS
ncbi:hypothetical protein chiPu_0021465 [Chiloscyllium punctatum]|uniref:Uncharacterized protein n=1 Tax=Chiloscyllium punctatum TaxID=137246 RepID=A0A401RFS9_CHIPU|nr:hypothetical protein [Chiloscyllium punctatum]